MGERGPLGMSGEQHKLRGTYRADRHGHLDGPAIASGTPSKPDWLDADASEAWDIVVTSINPAVLASLDTLLLSGCCRWWSTWRRLDRQLQAGSGDAYKATVMAASAWKQFDAAARRLGLDPTSRARMRVSPTPEVGEAATGKARFFGGVSARVR